MRHQVIGDKLAEVCRAPVLQGKGGFHVKGQGFISLAKARRLTGTPAPPRPRRERMPAWGDYATVVMLNQRRAARE